MNNKIKITAAAVAAAAAVGAGALVFNISKDGNDTPTVTVSQDITEAPTPPPTTEFVLPDDWSKNVDYVPSSHGITPKAKAMSKVNADYIAWMKIDGTPVDNPILLDPGEIQANDVYHGIENAGEIYYYLYRNLNKDYEFAGTVFMDYRNVLNSYFDEQSENLILHGHDMLNETMFGSFRRYRNEPGFYDKASYLELESKYGKKDYVIFAYLPTKGEYVEDGFNYWDMCELDTKKDFDAYVKNCKDGSLLDTGIDVQFGDKLITMSTCFNDQADMRFIVVARSLREGEKISDVSSIAHTKEWLDAQKAKAEAEAASKAQAEAEAASKAQAESPAV